MPVLQFIRQLGVQVVPRGALERLDDEFLRKLPDVRREPAFKGEGLDLRTCPEHYHEVLRSDRTPSDPDRNEDFLRRLVNEVDYGVQVADEGGKVDHRNGENQDLGLGLFLQSVGDGVANEFYLSVAHAFCHRKLLVESSSTYLASVAFGSLGLAIRSTSFRAALSHF